MTQRQKMRAIWNNFTTHLSKTWVRSKSEFQYDSKWEKLGTRSQKLSVLSKTFQHLEIMQRGKNWKRPSTENTYLSSCCRSVWYIACFSFVFQRCIIISSSSNCIKMSNDNYKKNLHSVFPPSTWFHLVICRGRC